MPESELDLCFKMIVQKQIQSPKHRGIKPLSRIPATPKRGGWRQLVLCSCQTGYSRRSINVRFLTQWQYFYSITTRGSETWSVSASEGRPKIGGIWKVLSTLFIKQTEYHGNGNNYTTRNFVIFIFNQVQLDGLNQRGEVTGKVAQIGEQKKAYQIFGSKPSGEGLDEVTWSGVAQCTVYLVLLIRLEE